MECSVRSVQRTVLLASGDYREPKQFAIAFDGSPTGLKMVDNVCRSPLLKGLPCHVVMADEPTQKTLDHLDAVRTTLAASGIDVRVSAVAGEPETALPAYLKAKSIPYKLNLRV